MRHKIKTDRLGRFSSYRKATIKSITTSVLVKQRVVTTKAKAKSARSLVDKVIGLGKKNTLFARRRAFSILCDHKLVKRLFDQIAPLFTNRAGGYTRIIPYRYRRGDNAQLVIFELTESYKEEKPEKKVKEEKETKPSEIEKKEPEISKKEKPTPVETEIKERLQPPKEKPIKTEVKEEEGVVKQERPHAHPEEEKHKKPEVKKPKKFLRGFKGFFKKERDSL
ncbi:MAG: 50S ribosomal protein L17 [Candidatus Omnitrophica bacterium]|nr:50S ribosomal protein L17 [Candidatus Omnitrophota bacterium]